MPTAAILPVKRFALAKQRLEPALGQGSRRALAAAMFADVLGALRHSTLIDTVILVSSEPVVRDAAADAADDEELVLIQDAAEKGQSNATLSGLARASALGYERALLVPGDTPLIDPLELDNLIANSTLGELDVVIVPDRHGSRDERAAARSGDLVSSAVRSRVVRPARGPGATARLSLLGRARCRRCCSTSTRAEDLAELRRAFEQQRGRAPRTQGVMMQIERSSSSAIPA